MSSIDKRLEKLEQQMLTRDEGGQIIITGQRLPVDEWEAIATDYMSRTRQIAAEMKRQADEIYK